MWRMQDGDRVLTGPEWAVFVVGLAALVDAVEQDMTDGADDAGAAVPVFGQLTAEQKLALLAEVSRSLRDPAVPTPCHTAAGEAAIAAVFAALQGELAAELQGDGGTAVRRRVRALAADYAGRPGKLPAPNRATPRVWADILAGFEDRVFWDDDYTLGDAFLDLPPEAARVQLELAGIDEGYFLAVPPEPGGRGLVAVRQTLARLLGRPAPDDDGLFPSLLDLHSDLQVGPVSPAEAGPWGDHPWVRLVWQTAPDWDCDLPTWQARFAGSLPARAFAVAPAAPGQECELPTGIGIEQCKGGWVVRDREGLYWCDLVADEWTNDLDADSSILSFPTTADAKTAFVQASQMYYERAARFERAMDQLWGLSGGAHG